MSNEGEGAMGSEENGGSLPGQGKDSGFFLVTRKPLRVLSRSPEI